MLPVLVIRSHFISIWKKISRYRCSECGAASFKIGERDSESLCILDRDITPLMSDPRRELSFNGMPVTTITPSVYTLHLYSLCRFWSFLSG